MSSPPTPPRDPLPSPPSPSLLSELSDRGVKRNSCSPPSCHCSSHPLIPSESWATQPPTATPCGHPARGVWRAASHPRCEVRPMLLSVLLNWSSYRFQACQHRYKHNIRMMKCGNISAADNRLTDIASRSTWLGRVQRRFHYRSRSIALCVCVCVSVSACARVNVQERKAWDICHISIATRPSANCKCRLITISLLQKTLIEFNLTIAFKE